MKRDWPMFAFALAFVSIIWAGAVITKRNYVLATLTLQDAEKEIKMLRADLKKCRESEDFYIFQIQQMQDPDVCR